MQKRPSLPYRLVPWPNDVAQRTAPDYGRADVMAVALESGGQQRVFVFQRSAAHPMLIFDRAGNYLRSWGSGLFSAAHGCRFGADGMLWLTDVKRHQVLRFTPDGKLLATWGVNGKPGADSRHFNGPADVTFGPRGDIYIADGYGNARVVHLSPEGRYLGAWGRRGTRTGEFHLVHALAVDRAGYVYVGDRENQRIQVFTSEGKWLATWSNTGYPFGLALLPDDRTLAVSDGVNNTVSLWDTTGKRLARWGRTGVGPGQFRRAHQLAVDSQDGALYVTEVKGRRVQKFLP